MADSVVRGIEPVDPNHGPIVKPKRMQTTIILQAALTGDRIHPAAPRDATAIAEAARGAVEAGAHSVHVHAFDDTGRESLEGSSTDRRRAVLLR